MADTTKLAAEILEMVGGADNVTFVAHCHDSFKVQP